jgi:hypothetical protein
MAEKIEIDVECTACKGTGVYVGMGERNGAAVVCKHCDGIGKIHMTLTLFTSRHKRDNITRVHKINPGWTLTDDPADGGIPYKDWLAGKPFPPGSENRRRTCPRWWFQFTSYGNHPTWDECGYGRIDECEHFPWKDQCWTRWDEEHAA